MQFNSGDTAWMLASAALVLFMTPGLAFFYAGMVRAKNVIHILVQNYVAAGVVSIIWVVLTYTLAFGPDLGGNGILGGLHFFGLANMTEAVPGYTGALAQTIPPLLFVAFQMKFAIITPALFTGSIAERMRFTAFITIITLWSIVVYAPIAHWVFSPNGFLFKLGALDFAGGAVVHINAGAAGLALAILLGKRKGWPKSETPSHNLPFVLLGTGLLWFGWFGFNAGSALTAGSVAAYALVNTNTAAAAALVTWILVAKFRGGKPTALGVGSGAVAGLVAITPAAGYVNPMGALIIGVVAGVICNYACELKYRLRIDDALDVFGVHLVGGVVGALSIGFLATKSVNSAISDGIFFGGSATLLGHQAIAVITVIAYSFVATLILGKLVDLAIGLRVSEKSEETGLDLTCHGEVAYDFTLGAATAKDTQEQRVKTRERERTGHNFEE